MGMAFGKSTDSTYFNFFAPGNRYNITKFQRSYTWGEYQIKGILNDLKHIADESEQVGWPSILIQEQEKCDADPNLIVYDLGDGQQRIISVSLGLIALWQAAFIQKSMNNITDEEFEFFTRIIPLTGTAAGNSGLLVTLRTTIDGLQRDPTVRFFSASANKIFKKMLTPLDADDWKELDKIAHNDSDGSGMAKALGIYYAEFRKFDLSELKAAVTNLLENVTLSVLIYGPKENMQRAFANMNSLGVALTQAELLKAEFYGYIKTKNSQLAETIAEYWTNNLETSYWASYQINHDSAFQQKKRPALEQFLEEFLYAQTNWKLILKGDSLAKIKSNNGLYWLRDAWSEHLRKVDNLEVFWSDFQKSVELFKILKSEESFHPGSLNWEVNYAYSFLNRVKNMISIFIKLNLAMSEADFKLATQVMTKNWLYLHFVTRDSRSMNNSLIHVGSPILNDKITYDEVRYCLENVTAHKRQWRPKEYIIDILVAAEFDDSFNTELCDLFGYITNEERREQGDLLGLVNAKSSKFGQTRSREHILSQTPREGEIADDDLPKYNSFVQRLGNTLILPTKINSSAHNRPVSAKIAIYQATMWGTMGVKWISDFMSLYQKTNSWEYDSISQRSKDIAVIIAEYLAPLSPYSDFRILLNDNDPEDIFTISDEDSEFELILKADGTLSLNSGYKVGSLKDLRPRLPEPDSRRTLQLIKKGDGKHLKQYVFRLGGDVTESTVFNHAASKKIQVTSDTFTMEGPSLKEIYLTYVKHHWVNNKNILLESFPGRITGISKSSEVAKIREHLYSVLDETYSIYTLKNQFTFDRDMKIVAKAINEDIKILFLDETKTQTGLFNEFGELTKDAQNEPL